MVSNIVSLALDWYDQMLSDMTVLGYDENDDYLDPVEKALFFAVREYEEHLQSP